MVYRSLIAIFIIFIINFGEAFSFSVIEAAKCSSSCGSDIIQVINVPEKMKVITHRIATCPDKCIFDTKRLGNVFATCEGFLDNVMRTVSGDWQWFFDPFDRYTRPCDSSWASANIVYRIMKMMGDVTFPVVIKFGGWVNFFQKNRMHSEFWAVCCDKPMLDKFNTFFSGVSGFFCNFPQQDVANNETSSEDRYKAMGIGYTLDSLFVFFCFGMVAASFFFGGIYLIDDYGQPFWGWICISFAIYIVLSPIGLYSNFCLSRWWWWFL